LLRVASVPSSHVYVRHLSPVDGTGAVERLPDPVPADGRKVPGGWWPPLMLDPEWVKQNHGEFDLFHIHFGFDAIDPATLAMTLSELESRNIPLVYTVHDLRNPHHPEPDAHNAQQDVLVKAADALVTLTTGAAEYISRRWNRSATVLPHPHVLHSKRIERPRRTSNQFTIGIHAKSLRANMDPLPLIDVLAEKVRELPNARLQINVHDELFDPDNHWYAPEIGQQILEYRDKPDVVVRMHPYFTDNELWDYLESLTVSVLPYRFGTHSGWLEACHDLGTAVIAPSCGFYGQQQECEVFRFDEHRFDADGLRTAVENLYTRWLQDDALPRATWPERLAQRTRLADTHLDLYEEVLT
jgi:Glycosyltransferase Family 4